MGLPVVGLVGRYRFDEGSGLATQDDSSLSNHGTLSTSNMWTSDAKSVTAITLGNNKFVDLGNASNLFGLTDSFSLYFFVKSENALMTIRALDLGFTSSPTDSGNRGIIAGVNDGDISFRVRQSFAGGYAGGLRGEWRTGLTVKSGEYNLIVCKRNNTNAYAKIINSDGVIVNSISLGGSYPLSNWGNYPNVIGKQAQGDIYATESSLLDEILLYNRLTSDQEDMDVWLNFITSSISGEIQENLAVTSWNVMAISLDDFLVSAQEFVPSGAFQLQFSGGRTGPHLVTVSPDIGNNWLPESSAIVGQKCFPTDPATTPYYFRCTIAGTTGTTEPAWQTGTPGALTADGTAEWELVERIPQPITHGPLIPQ